MDVVKLRVIIISSSSLSNSPGGRSSCWRFFLRVLDFPFLFSGQERNAFFQPPQSTFILLRPPPAPPQAMPTTTKTTTTTTPTAKPPPPPTTPPYGAHPKTFIAWEDVLQDRERERRNRAHSSLLPYLISLRRRKGMENLMSGHRQTGASKKKLIINSAVEASDQDQISMSKETTMSTNLNFNDIFPKSVLC